MRKLDTHTLDAAAEYYAAEFRRKQRTHMNRVVAGPNFVVQEFYKFTYLDEWEYLRKAIKEWLPSRVVKEFERMGGNIWKKRNERAFHKLLAEKLAVDPDGAHIPGRIGTVQRGNRLIGMREVEVETPDSLRRRKRLGLPKSARETFTKLRPYYWPIYAGELEERLAGSDAVDEFPAGTPSLAVGATNTRISNEVAILMCDAAVDNLDEGTGAAVVQGRSGAQPADPDTTVTGTLLFTLVCFDPAFGAASDAAPGATATANTVTADSSADATATVGYCRASATNDGATPLDDHIDGEAGTSGADFNFNTTAIVSGANVELTSWTVTMPES